MGEFRRIFNIRIIIVIAVAVALNLCLFAYRELSGRSILDAVYASQEYNRLVARYQTKTPADAYTQVGNEFVAVRKFAKLASQQPASDIGDDVAADTNTADTDGQMAALFDSLDEASQEMVEYYETLSPSRQTQLELEMKRIKEKLSYLSNYASGVDTVISNGENMKRFSIFSKANSFSYSNIMQTQKDFQRVEDVQLKLDADRGVDAFVNYYYLYYIAAALMTMIIYDLFTERDNGVWPVVHNTPSGRMVLAVKRLALTVVSALGILGILYFSTFFVSMLMYGGWKDLSDPVQTLSSFDKFTWCFSKRGYVLMLFFLSWFTLSGATVIMWMLFTVFRNRNHTLVCTATFVGIEVLVYQKISIQSVYNAFHYINVVTLLKINELYSSYLNWGFGTYVFSVFSIVFFSLAMLMAISAVVAVRWYANMRPQARVCLLARFLAVVHRQYQKLFAHYSVVIKELHKLVITGRGVWVIVAVVIIAAYFSASGQMAFTDAQKEYDSMYLKHGGEDYGYIIDDVAEKMAEYNTALQAATDAQAKYNNGEVSMSDYIKVLNNLSYEKNVVSSLREYQTKTTYLQGVSDTYGINAWMISDRGYEEIFGQYGAARELILMLALVTGIMFIISESISLEYRTGMNNIVKSCVNGRRWLSVRKFTACILFTAGLTVIVYGIDLWNLNRLYGMPYLSAPLISLTFVGDSVNTGICSLGIMKQMLLHVSVGMLLIVRFLIRLIAGLLTMAVALIVSRSVGKKGNRAVMPVALAVIIAVIVLVSSTIGIL